MSKNIVILLGSYYPNYSAVGVCAKKLVENLAMDNNVRVVSFANGANKQSKSLARHEVFFIKNRYNRVVNALMRVFSPFSLNSNIIKQFEQKLLELNSIDKIDVVIPMSFPYESNQAALKFKKKHQGVLLIPCLLDEYVSNSALHYNFILQKLKSYFLKKNQQFLISQSDRVIMLRSVFDNIESGFEDTKKIYSVLPPLIDGDGFVSVKKTSSKCLSIVYAGSLTTKHRDPLKLINGLTDLSDFFNSYHVSFKFFGNGDGYDFWNSMDQNKMELFRYAGSVSYDESTQLMRDADFLLSVGDNSGRQISSKIFEYMNMGKPILHYSYVNNCATGRLLEKYPFSFIIAHGEVVDLEKFHKFIKMEFSTYNCNLKMIYPEATSDFYRQIILS
ncbi:hypothetical protein VHARVF571_90143 [Vibrio harveyi]|uniref:hypothetical protein n=1 Tax=Vibrio harveyi TaxID=669 RepID=UPI002893BADE|nr:hypothetical protein VHARVF571_90143 [Vibrio harveyi]